MISDCIQAARIRKRTSVFTHYVTVLVGNAGERNTFQHLQQLLDWSKNNEQHKQEQVFMGVNFRELLHCARGTSHCNGPSWGYRYIGMNSHWMIQNLNWEKGFTSCQIIVVRKMTVTLIWAEKILMLIHC